VQTKYKIVETKPYAPRVLYLSFFFMILVLFLMFFLFVYFRKEMVIVLLFFGPNEIKLIVYPSVE